MALLKGNPEALKAYRERKAKALARTAPARKRADAAKAAHNTGSNRSPSALRAAGRRRTGRE
jgi:hypothetical protein